MYLTHFGLQRHPFRMSPEDDFVFMSKQHARAFVYMDSTLWSSDGFVVITGEVGAGKTTLLKKLIKSLRSDVCLVHLPYTQLKNGDLFQLVSYQAGLGDPGTGKISSLVAFRRFLEARADKGIPVVLAVDEAQNLTRENLEDIRMLANMENRSGPMMRVILLGQPELSDLICALPQFTQRVKLFFHLNGLNEVETVEYIAHRLDVAGCTNTNLFGEQLTLAIHRMSGGIPRIINKLCDGLLLCAFADERHLLEIDDLKELELNLAPSGSETNSTKADTANNSTNKKDGNSGSESELARIASVLERIEKKLGVLLQKRATKRAPKRSVYRESQGVDEVLLATSPND